MHSPNDTKIVRLKLSLNLMLYSLVPVPLGAFQINELISIRESELSNEQNPHSQQKQQVIFSLIVPTYNESKNLAQLVEVLTSSDASSR